MSEYKPGEFFREDFKRTYKLFTFKDVGVGWQVVRARDLYPTWVKPVIVAPPKYTFTKTLSGIRVADELKISETWISLSNFTKKYGLHRIYRRLLRRATQRPIQ